MNPFWPPGLGTESFIDIRVHLVDLVVATHFRAHVCLYQYFEWWLFTFCNGSLVDVGSLAFAIEVFDDKML